MGKQIGANLIDALKDYKCIWRCVLSLIRFDSTQQSLTLFKFNTITKIIHAHLYKSKPEFETFAIAASPNNVYLTQILARGHHCSLITRKKLQLMSYEVKWSSISGIQSLAIFDAQIDLEQNRCHRLLHVLSICRKDLNNNKTFISRRAIKKTQFGKDSTQYFEYYVE
jgi:hypothetical protein